MSKVPLVQLENCLVRPFSDAVKKSIFENPISLTINPNERWAVTGPRKTELLNVLAAKYIPQPALSRQYPFLEKNIWPSQAIQLVEFKGSIPVSHLSARYEHFRDEFDFSLCKYLGQSLGTAAGANSAEITKIMHQLKLDELANRWVVGLSNGQMRRARLARALLQKPRILLIDDPYLGLDPSARGMLSDVLEMLPPNPHVVIGLRYQDRIPSWITHVAITNAKGIIRQGPIHELEDTLAHLRRQERDKLHAVLKQNDQRKHRIRKQSTDVILELDKINISYNGQVVLKDLKWQVRRGEKWHLRGDNGTGKSTLLSMITADHPQSWNRKIIINGVPRKTGKHNYFSINEMIGHASPEIHALFPLELTAYESVSTGYIVGSLVPPRDKLSDFQKQRITDLLAEFKIEPNTPLHDLSLSDQKTVLFLRSVVKIPDILILDEAFSGMDSWRVEQCKAFMDRWEGTVITVGHVEDELPLSDKYIRLHGKEPAEQGEIEHKNEKSN